MMRKFTVIDIETTGQLPEEGDRIIEIGIVTIENDRIKQTYSTFINPNQQISPFITNLTGIRNEDVQTAPSFLEVADDIKAYFEGAYFVAHNVPFDLRFLNDELQTVNKQPINIPVLDTVELARIFFPQAGEYKLNRLANYLHIDHQEPHRALSDAIVTAKIFLKIKEKLKQLPYETISHLLQLEKSFHSDIKNLLYEQKEKMMFDSKNVDGITTYQGIAFKYNSTHNHHSKRPKQSFGALLDDIFRKNGFMQNAFSAYERREGQREMSETIYDSFQAKQHAFIEAGTGVGKSIAYLIPAIYYALKNQERIVISTYTTQLQAQLFNDEIPILRDILPFSFQVSLVKGKAHYISLKQFHLHLMNSGRKENYELALTKAMILVWLTETNTGDIDEVNLPTGGYHFFQKINAKAEGEVDAASPWFRYSYYHRARAKARYADIIVTNHAMLCADMNKNFELLPSYKFAIIDEAHQFEHAVAEQSSLTLEHAMIQYVLNQLGTVHEQKFMAELFNDFPHLQNDIDIKDWNRCFQRTKDEVEHLFAAIYKYVVDQQISSKTVSDIGRIQHRITEKSAQSNSWSGITEIAHNISSFIMRMQKYLQIIYNRIRTNTNLSTKYLHDIIYFNDLMRAIYEQLEQFFSLNNFTDHVRWVEAEKDHTVYLYQERVQVAAFLQKNLFAHKQSIIFTSATLTTKNSFSHMIGRLGLHEQDVMTKQISAPFDYENQVKFMVPKDFPNIATDQEEFIYSTCEAIYSLAKITQGRMLVLFTSYEMLRQCYRLLHESMDTEEFMIFAQGISSGSRSRLKKNFQSFENSILLGTSSFWEGVDIPGDDLSCLMIVRLPFQPPTHPVYEAKANLLERQGENPFFKLALPEAVLRFKQGFGRLIRSKRDRGIIFVCDQRLMTARYRSFFLESIPNVSITYDSTYQLLQEAEEWF